MAKKRKVLIAPQRSVDVLNERMKKPRLEPRHGIKSKDCRFVIPMRLYCLLIPTPATSLLARL